MSHLTPVDEALATILAAFSPLPLQKISLQSARGKTLLEDVIAGTSHPLADMSSMDGFALRSEDTGTTTPVTVVGESAAGAPFAGTLEKGQAVRIYTGAYLPNGADTIILLEETEEQDGTICAPTSLPEGRFIRRRAQDFGRDDCLIPAGSVLTSRLMALAALGLQSQVTVRRAPRIAIISSGNELVPAGGLPRFGQLINSNAIFLAQTLTSWGAEVTDLGILPDEEGALAKMLDDAAAFDLIVTTGGASVGKYDFMAADIAKNTELGFWKIAMRPGKPLIFGHYDGTPLLGLPGNPVSVAICSLVFLAPVLAKLTATPTLVPAPITAISQTELPENDRRQDYLRAVMTKNDSGQAQVTAFAKQDSAMWMKMAEANAVIIRAPFAPAISAGTDVMAIPLPAEF